MTVEELLNKVDIVEYIEQYVDLEERNGEFWGLSPFTDEKTPSFSVNREKQNFYCFSSGIGGSLITFISNYYKVPNWKAIKKLEGYADVDECSSYNSIKSIDAISVIKKFRSRDAFTKKGIAHSLPLNCMDKYIIDDAKLADWENEGISRESLRKFDVRYDPLSNRIVYPIRDLSGAIVNIGTRTLDKQWKEKGIRKYSYMQKWGTIECIYGLYDNREDIIKKKELIIFEGAKSVMKCDTWGYKNGVAILTSHLSDAQTKILFKFCIENKISITFALDKDVKTKQDHNIRKIKNYLNVFYIWDYSDLLDDKDSPVDKGKDVFDKLFDRRLRI